MKNLIDTIKLRYTLESDKQLNDLIEHLKANYASTFKETRKLDGIKSFHCSIKNVKISIYHYYVYIEGSIHKFYMGNNIIEMELQDLGKSFTSLGNCLGNVIDIKSACIRRIDFGINLIMNHKPTAYVNKLHSSSTKKSTTYNDQTIYTGNASRGMIVYDKAAQVNKEAKIKNKEVQIEDNLLRLEARIKGRSVFEKHFGSKLPTIEDLLYQLHKLPEIWYSEYKRLHKEYAVNVDCIKNQKDLFIYTITIAGYEKCKHIIDYSYNLDLISKQDMYRYTNTIKGAFQKPTVSIEQDLMQELDNKVLTWYNKTKLAS